MTLLKFFSQLNENFTLYCVLPGILFLGIYLTIRLKFVQITKLSQSAKNLLSSDGSEQGSITHYQALSAVVAGNLGTGNISGMAIALTTGGAGALVWMWVMAFLGATIQYTSCVLGVKYRQKEEDGQYQGGPMYYLEKGLGLKKIAVIFSFFTLIAAMTVGNFAQVNSIVLPLKGLGFPPFILGIMMTFIVGVVTLGGTRRLAKVASSIVPVMALIYLLGALIVLCANCTEVIPAFKRMLTSAFAPKSVAGGFLGYGMLKALTVGFDRGVFATDAGTGIVPILQSSAKTKSPIVDGMVTLIAPFIVMIMCTTTGLVLLVTGAADQVDLRSTNMVIYAFSQVMGSTIGSLVVITSLSLFAYTTIIAWGCCGERAASYLWGANRAKWFQYVYLVLIPIGAVAHVDLVWVLADISISLMLITNFIGVTGLSSEVIRESKLYFSKESMKKETLF
ncbi:MAG: sodium:alanine symporter family protein [Chlamydiae bacterium]|nr:sodium:alanine symporter family protein [Chlamydiota bacterium]